MRLDDPNNDFDDLARALNQFEHHYNEIAEPFDWHITSADLAQLLNRLAKQEPHLRLAASNVEPRS